MFLASSVNHMMLGLHNNDLGAIPDERPPCAKLDIVSLHRWAASGNVFDETKSHGVRQLVTAPELLAPIE